MQTELAVAVARAAARVATSAAARSLAELERMSVRPISEPVIPDPDHMALGGILQLVPGEVWCQRCGSEGSVYAGDSRTDQTRMCIRCSSRRLVPAAAVLRPDEFYIVN
jgi:hypothetical protein